MQRLLFIKSRTASFIELDERLLAERFDVHELYQPGRFSDPRKVVKEVLAADVARVAVMARGQAALDDTVSRLESVGSPEAVGISVDMTDPASIAAAFRDVNGRWGSLNVLVHTIGPGAGRFEDLDDADG